MCLFKVDHNRGCYLSLHLKTVNIRCLLHQRDNVKIRVHDIRTIYFSVLIFTCLIQ